MWSPDGSRIAFSSATVVRREYAPDYSGAKIGEGTAKPGLEPPIYYWDPSIAPSGMAFYTGDAFPAWRGNLLVGEKVTLSLDISAVNVALPELAADLRVQPLREPLRGLNAESVGKELLRELAHPQQARLANERALDLATNPAQRAILQQRG